MRSSVILSPSPDMRDEDTLESLHRARARSELNSLDESVDELQALGVVRTRPESRMVRQS